ncbi:chitin deacetylase [Phlyctochytrium planicorne]|nr:chitin deacetylase [Phlyctochytrium planicorne]
MLSVAKIIVIAAPLAVMGAPTPFEEPSNSIASTGQRGFGFSRFFASKNVLVGGILPSPGDRELQSSDLIPDDANSIRSGKGLNLMAAASTSSSTSSFPVTSPPNIAPINTQWTDFYLKGANIPNMPLTTDGATAIDFIGLGLRTKCTQDGVWAQTFDDGPKPASNALLDKLKQKNLKTTFFNLGVNVVENGCIMKRKEDEGHVNCLHTWSHHKLTTLTNDQIVAEVVWNALAVKQATGRIPRCIRPPSGDVDARVVAVLKAMGLEIVWINQDTRDFEITTGGRTVNDVINVINNVVSKGHPVDDSGNPFADNSILSLEHDIDSTVAGAGIQAIDLITASKFKYVNINECLGTTGLQDGMKLPTNIPIGLPALCQA